MKSVYQILKEYRNRQRDPQYNRIRVVDNSGQTTPYYTISNLRTVHDSNGIWLEFDNVQNLKKIHTRVMAGWVCEYHVPINE